MRTGNIVKTAYDHIVIITKVSDDYINWVSASSSNVSGGTHILTTEKEVNCHCTNECCGHPDIECTECKGTGKIIETRYGMDKATYLADNMVEYIKKRMLKNFDF